MVTAEDNMLIEEQEIILKTGEKITIKSATAEHAKMLAEHRYITSCETHFMARYPEECKFNIETMKDYLQSAEESENDFLVTAFADGVIIGDAGVSQIRNHLKFRHRAYMGISIQKAYCNKGLGNIMVKIAVEQAKRNGFEQLELGVFSDNPNAICLYEKSGFKKVGIMPRAFKLKDGTYRDEIQMVHIFDDVIKLVKPSMEYEEDLKDFRQEIQQAKDADAFAGCGDLGKVTTIKEWIDLLEKYDSVEKCPEGKVPSTTYLAVRKNDNRIVGIIDLRHHINHPILKLWGGHIGYSVRPSERKKGYGKEMLRLNLEKCRERGLEKVMVTCSRENTASANIIKANGGVFEKEVLVEDEYVQRYWITL